MYPKNPSLVVMFLGVSFKHSCDDAVCCIFKFKMQLQGLKVLCFPGCQSCGPLWIFNQFGRCFRFAFLLLKITGQLSLTEVWICSNFHTKFSQSHVVCINSHISFLVLIHSHTCLLLMFAPSVRMDNSPTLTQLPFLSAA